MRHNLLLLLPSSGRHCCCFCYRCCCCPAWCCCWNEYVTIAVNRNLSNWEIARKKVFRCFNGIRTAWRLRSPYSALPAELWRPIHWRLANLLSSSTRERNETQNEMMWTAGIPCDSLRWSHIHFICSPAVHIISFDVVVVVIVVVVVVVV